MIRFRTTQPGEFATLWGLCWLACALLLPVSNVQAQEAELQAVELPVGNNHSQPFERMQFWLDKTGGMDAAAALQERANFQPVSEPWIDFGDADATVWLLFKVHNSTEREDEWILDIQRPFVDDLIVAKVNGVEIGTVLLTSDNTSSFADRPVISQYLVAPLPMSSGETTEILIGMRSSTGSWMPVTLATQERMRTAHMQEARTNWLINGAIAMLVFAALAMGRLIGWRSALPFAVYAISGALFVANNEGYLHRFIWPELPWLYQPVNVILIPIMALSGLQFARGFTELDQHHPAFNKALGWVLLGIGAVGLSALLLWSQGWFQSAVYGLAPFSAALYVALGWIALRRKALGALPFFIGTVAVALTVAFTAAVTLLPGRLPLTVALDYIHITLLIETLAFFIAIVARALAIQRNLNVALKSEVELTKEKLELAEQLQSSRSRYDKARDQAEAMRARLASTSHDLQQPMLSLRQGLQSLKAEDSETAERIDSALDYLESVAAQGLVAPAAEDTLAGEKPDEGHEDFPVSIVTKNCAAMFESEARSQSVQLAIEDSDLIVRTDPISLMRSVSNLISNALKHAGATKIDVQCIAMGDQVAISVADDGVGLSEEQATELTGAYAKGDDSKGHGLGLHLVNKFAHAPGHSFTIVSHLGQGATMTICVPAGADSDNTDG